MPDELIGTDLTRIFDFGLPENSHVSITYDPATGILVAKAAYS